MRRTVFSRLRLGARNLLRDQRGNALMLTAAATIPVIGIVGSAVDIGRAYMTQLRLQQACDAGVLAGRRAMGPGIYGDAAKAEANKMFNFNFPAGSYGSSDAVFSTTPPPQGSSDVAGTASARLPTALMFIFGTDAFNLSVGCAAKLEIANVDVMMVLDVTGSMQYKTDDDDDVTKIVGLRAAAKAFFAEMASADVGNGRIRFGVVPYSTTVNVGAILKPEWLSDTLTIASREPKFEDVWQDVSRTQGTPTNSTPSAWSGWSSTYTVNGLASQNACRNAATIIDGVPTTTTTSQYIDGSGNQITKSDIQQGYKEVEYRNAVWTAATWSNPSRCSRQERSRTYTRTTPETLTQAKPFKNYNYFDRPLAVAAAKDMSTEVKFNTGSKGVEVTSTWGGCIMERQTAVFGPNETAPADAFDMNIDMVPSGDDATKWKLYLPAFTFNRGQVAPLTSDSNFGRLSSAACPHAAMKLKKVVKAKDTDTATEIGETAFGKYIDLLLPVGGTYHDVGMAWGARLISPTGLFKDANADTDGKPISRHIIFMTDGMMEANPANLSHQGVEESMARVGATGSRYSGNGRSAYALDADARHNNRFLQLCKSARDKGMTIWVVSFGVGTNSNLDRCATSGKALEAKNSAKLNEQFQTIARQISKLRLSK